MVCVVAPVDQRLLLGAEDAKTTCPPKQKVVDVWGVITGAVGLGFTVTGNPAEMAVQPAALLVVTVYVPLTVAEMELVVSAVDHTLLEDELERRVTLPPSQNVVGPPGEMVGTGGLLFTVTTVGADTLEHPLKITV
jgi:hypothetical protein